MSTTPYRISRGAIEVTAHSAVHDTRCVWSKVSGEIQADAAAPGDGQATARIAVDMRAFDAGDRLKNWKLKSDIDPDRYPTATFVLERLDGVRETGGGRWEATAVGALEWRGRRAAVRAVGFATFGPSGLEATAKFELNVRDVGVEPPKILMIKVADVVNVEVTISAALGV